MPRTSNRQRNVKKTRDFREKNKNARPVKNPTLSSRSRNPSSRRSSPHPTPSFTTRETLLKAAKHQFALRGLSGTSIREIAKAAKMNSSQISYYFENKEGLYRACLMDIALGRLKMAEQILLLPNSKTEYAVRLRLFAENLMDYFLEDRDTGLIIIREFDRTRSPAESVFKNYFSKLFELLILFFKHAQKQGHSKLDGDSLIVSGLFFGAIMNELRMDHIKENLFGRSLRHPRERQAVIEHIVALFA